MKKIFLSLILFSAFLVSCGTTKVVYINNEEPAPEYEATPKASPRPEWVLNPSSVYPEDLYLSQVGEGYTKTEAFSNAQLALAKFFGQKVQSTTIGTESISLSSQNGYSSEQEIESEYVISFDTTLYAVEKTKPWYDADSDSYFVCVYMDRNKAFEFMKPNFVNSRDEFYKFYNASIDETDLFKKIDLLNQTQQYGANYLQNLKAILAIVPTAFDRYRDDLKDIANVKILLEQLSNDASVNITVINDYDNKFKDVLSKYFTDYGFSISEKNYNYNVVADIKENTNIDEFSGLMSSHPDVTISLKDASGVRTFLSYTASVPTQKAYSDILLRKKVIKAIEDELSISFVEELDSFMNK